MSPLDELKNHLRHGSVLDALIWHNGQMLWIGI